MNYREDLKQKIDNNEELSKSEYGFLINFRSVELVRGIENGVVLHSSITPILGTNYRTDWKVEYIIDKYELIATHPYQVVKKVKQIEVWEKK